MKESSEETPTVSAIKMVSLHLSALDAGWSVGFSEYTNQFYVSMRAEIGGNGLLTSVCEHRDTPTGAIIAVFHLLTLVAHPEFIVTDSYSEHRKHWRWNGATFVEVARGK